MAGKSTRPSSAWSDEFFCFDCRNSRPWFLAATKERCIPCQREKNRLKMQKSRLKNDQALQRQRDLARKQFLDPALRRCRDSYYKIRARSPKTIPKWVTIESLLPIYEHADYLDRENPEFRHVIGHISPMLMDEDVCGLHTIDNLQIVRFKRMNGTAACPAALT